MSNIFFLALLPPGLARLFARVELLRGRLRFVPVVALVEPLVVRLPRYYSVRRGSGDIEVEGLLE